MISYDDLIDSLEEAWIQAGLHEHALVESVQPATLDRGYRAELFPEHGEPLTEENMPPWVEVSFTWSAAHQLRAEGRVRESDSLALIWNYMVLVPEARRERGDQELVRLFQKAVFSVLQRFYPGESEEMSHIAVEVRRIYQSDGQRNQQAYVQLLSTNLTDLSEHWQSTDPMALHRSIRTEVQFASAVIQALADVFGPDGQGTGSGNGGYRAVDAA